MKTKCPNCGLIIVIDDECKLTTCYYKDIIFKGDELPFLMYDVIIDCYVCGKNYVWVQNPYQGFKWSGCPTP